MKGKKTNGEREKKSKIMNQRKDVARHYSGKTPSHATGEIVRLLQPSISNPFLCFLSLNTPGKQSSVPPFPPRLSGRVPRGLYFVKRKIAKLRVRCGSGKECDGCGFN